MNWRKILTAGTVACMIAATGCSSNIPENNQGNRNGMRLTASASDNALKNTRGARNTNATRSARSTRSTWNIGSRTRTASPDSAYSNENINRRARNSAAKGYSDYDANYYNRVRNYTGSNVNRSASAPVNRTTRVSNAERLNRNTLNRGTVAGKTAPSIAALPRTTTAPRATIAPRTTTAPRAKMAPRTMTSPRATMAPRATAAPRATMAPRTMTAPRATMAPRATLTPGRNLPGTRVTPRTTALPRPTVSPRNRRFGNTKIDNARRTLNNYDFSITRGSGRYADNRMPNRYRGNTIARNIAANEETVLAMANTTSTVNVKKAEIDKIINTLNNLKSSEPSTGATRSTVRTAPVTNSTPGQSARGKTVYGNRSPLQTIYIGKYRPDANGVMRDTTKSTVNENNGNRTSMSRSTGASNSGKATLSRSAGSTNRDKTTLSRSKSKTRNELKGINRSTKSRNKLRSIVRKAKLSGNKISVNGRSVPARKILNEALRLAK